MSKVRCVKIKKVSASSLFYWNFPIYRKEIKLTKIQSLSVYYMSKNFQANTYIVDHQLNDTLTWLCCHQDSFDSFSYDAIQKTLVVYHANGQEQIMEGDYLNASYGILITAHNFAKTDTQDKI